MSGRFKDKEGAERRIDERVPTQIRVRLKYPDVETFLERYATNISRGGIFIQTQRTKPPGTLIRFEFQLQDASPVIRGEGRVSWVVSYDPTHAERAYGMGVKFTRLDARSKSFIDRIVAQKLKRGQTDNANSPPPPEEAQLAQVHVSTHEAAADEPIQVTPPRAIETPLATAPAPPAAPVLPDDVEELLASGPAVDPRAAVTRVLGQGPHGREVLDRLLGELDSAVPPSSRPAAARREARPAPRPEPTPAAVVAPPAPVPAPTVSEAPPSAPVAVSMAEAFPPPDTLRTIMMGPESLAAALAAAVPGPPFGEEPAAAAPSSSAPEPAPPEPGPERIDRLLEQPSGSGFALDLEEMASPPPDTAAMRRTPAPQARRTPAPLRRSERALPRVVPPPAAPVPEPEPEPEPEVGAEPVRVTTPGAGEFVAPPGFLPASELEEAMAAAAAEPQWGEPPSPLEATQPSVEAPPDDGSLLPDFGDSGGDAGTSVTVESPPEFTPPAAQDLASLGDAVSLLGIEDPFAAARPEEEGFPMDVGPLLDDDGGGPPAERTMIGGAGFEFGGADGMPDQGLEVTATHPPMPTTEPGIEPESPEGEQVFFDGELGEVPPDAGAQVGLPELDMPLVDDFEAPRGLESYDDVEMTPHDPLLAAAIPEPDATLTAEPALPEEPGEEPPAEEGFAYARTVLAPVPDEEPPPEAEPMPELMIDEGSLEASTSSEEVTARQSPLPPEPTEGGEAPAPGEEPKKGFFRKLFGNK